jgi:hypothetical protein
MKRLEFNWPEDKIKEFCRRWKIRRLELFGSALREDFQADSDVDILVSLEPDANWSLFDHMNMEEELAGIFGRKVDLISREAIEESRNWIRRKAILESAEVVYESR